jgi:hypothetical protein
MERRKIFSRFSSEKLKDRDHSEDLGVVGNMILELILETQPLIQWVPGALSLGVKRPGREADDLPPPSTKVKKISGLIPPLPQ